MVDCDDGFEHRVAPGIRVHSRIPEVQAMWQEQLAEVLEDAERFREQAEGAVAELERVTNEMLAANLHVESERDETRLLARDRWRATRASLILKLLLSFCLLR